MMKEVLLPVTNPSKINCIAFWTMQLLNQCKPQSCIDGELDSKGASIQWYNCDCSQKDLHTAKSIISFNIFSCYIRESVTKYQMTS